MKVGNLFDSSKMRRHDGAGALLSAPSNVILPGMSLISAALIAHLDRDWETKRHQTERQ